MKVFNILIGASEDVVIDFLKETISEEYEGEYVFEYYIAYKDIDIFSIADKVAIDIFILQLNNILILKESMSSNNVIDRGVEFVSIVKNKYKKPIISFSTFDEYEGIVEHVGSDSFLKFPLKIKELLHAFQKVL